MPRLVIYIHVECYHGLPTFTTMKYMGNIEIYILSTHSQYLLLNNYDKIKQLFYFTDSNYIKMRLKMVSQAETCHSSIIILKYIIFAQLFNNKYLLCVDKTTMPKYKIPNIGNTDLGTAKPFLSTDWFHFP